MRGLRYPQTCDLSLDISYPFSVSRENGRYIGFTSAMFQLAREEGVVLFQGEKPISP
jgi:hypothetical protein